MITPVWTAWCEHPECMHYEYLDGTTHTKGSAIVDARKKGWRVVGGKWLCPKHVREARRKEVEAR